MNTDPNFIKEVRKNIIAMDEDRKEACVSCGKEWYAIHFKNGYCYDCQNDGVMDRELKQKAWEKLRFRIIFFLVVLSLILLFSYVVADEVIRTLNHR